MVPERLKEQEQRKNKSWEGYRNKFCGRFIECSSLKFADKIAHASRALQLYFLALHCTYVCRILFTLKNDYLELEHQQFNFKGAMHG